jgi:hypothetical protein
MSRSRRWCALVLLLAPLLAPLALLWPARGKAPPATEKEPAGKQEEKWLVDRSVTLQPAKAPVPALRYRLYPAGPERKEGNAVPMYLRFAHERNDFWKKQLREKPDAWNKLPLEKLPLAEVKEFLDGYRYKLQQLELGARRTRAEWHYALDTGDPIGILLPDAQEMRMYPPLLLLKARVEMAERRFADAVRTLETGFSFSRQVSHAPFLINGLVGIACAQICLGGLEELTEQRGAPNLYWAMAVIPRPLIDLRGSNEIEHVMLEMVFPDLADLDRPRAAAEWDAVLVRIRQAFARLVVGAKNVRPTKPGNAVNDPGSKSPDLPAARKYLAEVAGLPESRIKEMGPAEVLLRYLSKYSHEARDEIFKATYLPFPEALHVYQEAGKGMETRPDTEAAELIWQLLPAIRKVQLAQLRLDRRLAMLRVIEALRMHAAHHDGKLPEKLDEVKVVPLPADPGTGKPFEYKLDGQTATLTSRIAGEPLHQTGLRYRVTMRK